jgi:hypothetical protein
MLAYKFAEAVTTEPIAMVSETIFAAPEGERKRDRRVSPV